MSTGPVASFSGLASGLQWQDTVDALMQIEAIPVNRLQQRKAQEQAKIEAWNSIQSKMTALQNASQDIDTANELLIKDVSSSDTDTLTASASSTAVASTHTVIINQLAQQEVLVHDTGWADLNATSLTSSGTDFAYDFDGTTYTVTLPSGATLQDLIDAINDDEDNPGITASSLNDGGDTDPYHLVLTADEASSTDTIAIDDAGTTIGSGTFDSAGWTRTVNAQQAEIRVDGYPSGSWITSDSNSVEGVIEGVTLNLKDTNATGITISVTEDDSATKAAIKGWVQAYNALVTEIDRMTRFDAETETRGILTGDSSLRNLKSDLITMVANEIDGVSSTATYKTLGSAGIDLAASGKLQVDDSDLLDALADNADEVVELFTLSYASSSPYLTFFKQESETEGGEYDVVVSYTGGGIDDTASNTIDGYAATVESGNILVGKEGTPVEGLRLYLDPPSGSGTINTTFRLSKGLASSFDSLVDISTDSIDGLVKNAKDLYESNIEGIDRQIESFNRRLAIQRDMYTRQFLAMEEAVSAAQGQANWISAI